MKDCASDHKAICRFMTQFLGLLNTYNNIIIGYYSIFALMLIKNEYKILVSELELCIFLKNLQHFVFDLKLKY